MTDTLDRVLKAGGGKIRGVGMPWFTRESWERMRAVAADRDNLPEDFAQFERIAGKRFDALIAAGHPVERVVFSLKEVNAIAAWCAAKGVPFNAHVRAGFASWKLADQHRNAGHG
jgi:hypothetical protein